MKLKRYYYGAMGLLPMQLLLKTSPANSVFPYHHIVSDESVPHIINLYPYKNARQFRQDLDFLLKYFEPVTPSDLVHYIQLNQKLPEKKFLLSFDDGFREINDVIVPILHSKGIPAIFFINPAFIDNKQMFYRNKISIILGVLQNRNSSILKQIAKILSVPNESFDDLKSALLSIRHTDKFRLDEIAQILDISIDDYLKKNRPWLTTEELKKISSMGFCIGAHSWDHPYYQSVSLNDQVKQTIESCAYVRQFEPQVTTFSFPHFDKGLSQQLFDELLKPEYGIDLLFGIQNQKNEIHNRVVHRFNCERPDVAIGKQIKGVFMYSLIQKILNKQTIIR